MKIKFSRRSLWSWQFVLYLSTTSLQAEINTDGTLGPAETLLGPNFTIDATLGRQAGGNLFHSFAAFTLQIHETATFTGPSTVSNILTRVTGGLPSGIDGMLRVAIPNANFYFFNPNGVVIGQDAQLDMSGSGVSYISTAPEIYLGTEGKTFAATPVANEILDAAPPKAFGFLDTSSPILIEVHGNDLTISNQQLVFPQGQFRLIINGKLQLEKGSLLNVSGASGGEIFIRAGELVLNDSELFADTTEHDGLGVDINVAGNMQLTEGAVITADNYGKGQGGKIQITAHNLSLINQLATTDELSKIATNNFSTGKGGNIEIDVASDLTMSPGLIQAATSYYPEVSPPLEILQQQPGQAGDISITAQRLELHSTADLGGFGGIHSNVAEVGVAGKIDIRATEQMLINHAGHISTSATGSGKSGTITLTTPDLQLQNYALINSASGGSGNAGDLKFSTDRLSLTQHSYIDAEAEYAGGGNIVIAATQMLSVTQGSHITAQAQGQAREHDGGNIDIDTPRLEIDNSYLLANAVGGRGGQLTLGSAAQPTLVETHHGAIFDVSSKQGLMGQLVLNDRILNDHFTVLAKPFVDASHWIKCSSTATTKPNSNVVLRKQLVSLSPAESQVFLTDLATLATTANHSFSAHDWQQNNQALAQLNAQSLLAQPLQFTKLLWQRGRLLQQQNQIDSALIFYRLAVTLLDLIRPALDRSQQPIAASKIFKQIRLELLTLLLQQGQLEEALTVLDRLKTNETLDYFYFKDPCQPPPVAIREINHAQTAIIYPVIFDHHLSLLLSLPTGLRQVQVAVTAPQLQHTVTQLREQLARRDATSVRSLAYLPLAQQLYQWLITPLQTFLTPEINTLVMVPDGPLYTIPLSVLHDGQHFLLEQYALAIMPSLTLTDPSSQPPQWDTAKVLFNGLTTAEHFYPLPQAHLMGQEIKKQFAGTALLTGSKFTQSQMTQTLKTSYYSIVHLFSHAQFKGSAADSFLVTYDAKMNLTELQKMIDATQAPIELLALGACETAKGDEQAALGFSGIAFKAGVHSAIGTLWQARSDVMQQVFTDFYHQLKTTRFSKAQALREAQLKLIRNYHYPPHFWSPFLLIGNWL